MIPTRFGGIIALKAIMMTKQFHETRKLDTIAMNGFVTLGSPNYFVLLLH